MPKIGAETIRRRALVEAAIHEIGRTGSLDVTVGQIAKRAGMSSGLAHHYFGSKEQMLVAAMRHLLSGYGAAVRAGLAGAEGPAARLDAILCANLDPVQFEPETVAAWLAFYVAAQKVPEARRLLHVYARRLHTNLMHELRPLVGPARAPRLAQTLAALIDGFYIRHALQDDGLAREEIVDILRGIVARELQETAP